MSGSQWNGYWETHHIEARFPFLLRGDTIIMCLLDTRMCHNSSFTSYYVKGTLSHFGFCLSATRLKETLHHHVSPEYARVYWTHCRRSNWQQNILCLIVQCRPQYGKPSHSTASGLTTGALYLSYMVLYMVLYGLLKSLNLLSVRRSSSIWHSIFAWIFLFVSIFVFLFLFVWMWSDCKKPLTESVLFHSAFSEYLSSQQTSTWQHGM